MNGPNNTSSWKNVVRIFQRFQLVKFIEKFKTHVKNLKIEKIIAFDQYLHKLFFAFYFHLSKNLFLTLKNNEVADLTHFLHNAAVLKYFKNNETVDCRQTFLNCFWNSIFHWKQFPRSSSNLNQTLSIIIQQSQRHFSRLPWEPMHFFPTLKFICVKTERSNFLRLLLSIDIHILN